MKALILGVSAACLLFFSSFTYVNSSNKTEFSEYGDLTIQHRIKLCSYSDVVPVKVVERLRQMEGVTPMKSEGNSVYLTSPYNSEDEAAKDLPNLKALGFEEAVQVVQVEDQILSVQRFHALYDDQNVNRASEKQPVIHIWK